ncbi:WD40-repeat-containing domain protein [Lipomyces oligophaga]|uniref:WD40-repeat-containing domain protein n=1 Tax=Lipomyces oligophaga TaxID=45792 RepID=UPI0034CDC4A2
MSISVRHIAIGANRVPYVASASPDDSGVVAFCADKYVALWAPEGEYRGVQTLLNGHSAAVSAVCFIGPGLLASGSIDGELRIWKRESQFGFSCISNLRTHSRSISALSETSDHKFMFAGSADGRVSCWRVRSFVDEPVQSIDPVEVIQLSKGFFPLGLAAETVRPKGSSPVYILAVGATNPRIQVFLSAVTDNPKFTQIAILNGHEDWVHAVAFQHFKEPDGADVLYLASGSQDRYIRLWKILPVQKYEASTDDTFLMLADPLFQNTMYKFDIPGTQTSEYAIVFDALLIGHDDWIFSISWDPTPARMRLLSASADSSLMIWAPDETSGIWVSQGRLGDLSIKGASSATGSSGGFWSALWDPRAHPKWVATVGKSGSWRVWGLNREDERWIPKVAVSGHTRESTGLSWSPDGGYLLTTSLDQTTRLLAELKRPGKAVSWHEFARPQIHGYDMICVASLTPTVFVSAGDEKVVRVFEMSRSVATMLHDLCELDVATKHNMKVGGVDDELPDAAAVPSLGLSNKAVRVSASAAGEEENILLDNDEDAEAKEDTAAWIKAVDSQTNGERAMPFESDLQRHTLFPEIDKLYGHGFEISALALTHNGRVLATACKANTAAHGVIRLFDTKHWREIRPPLAEAHALTITSLEFSPDDRYLLSTGRDRKFFIWERSSKISDESSESEMRYDLRYTSGKGHTRIIWDGSWAPEGIQDRGSGYVFATASRDRTLRLWSQTDEQHMWRAAGQVQKYETAVTAVRFRNHVEVNSAGMKWTLLALGFDNGRVVIDRIESESGGGDLILTRVAELGRLLSPVSRITCLKWRPSGRRRLQEAQGELAIASEDSSVRIITIEECK